MISIILPAYNAEATIAETVESVLAQNWAAFELIAIDDGSTDGTLDVLRRFDDPRLRIYAHANRGPSATRNRGISLARGEVLAWVDADDVWIGDKLEAQMDALRRCPEAAVAYGWVDYHDAAGQFVSPDRRATFHGDVYEDILVRNFISSGSNTMMRKRAVEAVGGFDESLPACEDWDLHVRLAARYSFVCVPAVVVRYRLSPGSLTSQSRLMEESHRRASSRLFAAAPPHLRKQSSKCDAAFFSYLAVRSAQAGMHWRLWTAALRYSWLSLIKSPGVALSLHTGALVRGSMALSQRALRRNG